MTTADFEPLRIIGKKNKHYYLNWENLAKFRSFRSIFKGKGAFGEVRICKCKKTGEIVAVKKMKKSEMVFKNQVNHVRAERDVLAQANIPWIVDLKYSFQVSTTFIINCFFHK